MYSRFIQLFFVLLLVLLGSAAFSPDWGFFGHKRINRLAVFTLPPEMIGFYKQNIDYITQHAVDPDKRRYASKYEAVRHYIDLDHWGEAPFDEVPRRWVDALGKYLEVYVVQSNGDTLQIDLNNQIDELNSNSYVLQLPSKYRSFVFHNIILNYYEDDWVIPCDSLESLLAPFSIEEPFDCQSAFAKDGFSGYGILPYHLVRMQGQLTKAFQGGDVKKILRLSTEFGHYLGDAHVPLHTTENYNGQMTNQVGIHGFWESRLPELFADETYDYFVGQAEYFDDPTKFYWDIILESNSYVKDLLKLEKELKAIYPSDQQFCFEQKGTRTIQTQCKEFCAKYHDLLDGQVEKRLTKAIRALGSAWYTAWVDAGQPDLSKLIIGAPSEEEIEAQKALQKQFESGKIIRANA